MEDAEGKDKEEEKTEGEERGADFASKPRVRAMPHEATARE